MTRDELLDALSSSRGQEILRKAVNQEVTTVLRSAFGRHAPGHEDDERVSASQRWLFTTVEKIRAKLDVV
jgi:hypothetical protein